MPSRPAPEGMAPSTSGCTRIRFPGCRLLPAARHSAQCRSTTDHRYIAEKRLQGYRVQEVRRGCLARLVRLRWIPTCSFLCSHQKGPVRFQVANMLSGIQSHNSSAIQILELFSECQLLSSEAKTRRPTFQDVVDIEIALHVDGTSKRREIQCKDYS